jgi:CheY-like chemotaxis protein
MAAERPLRFLILEDRLADAEILQRMLRQGGLSFTARVVDNKSQFVEQLEEFQPDLVLADYGLPGFSGFTALELARETSPDLPFILVSGIIGEELAVMALQLTATDYLLKDNLIRLVPAVRRAMREVEERRQLIRLEEQLHEAHLRAAPVRSPVRSGDDAENAEGLVAAGD